MKRCKRAAVLLILMSVQGTVPAMAGATASGETNAEGAKTLTLLQHLVQLDTTNPPGDTRKIAEYLRGLFAPLGIETEIVVAPNGKAAHFFARLKGDGSKPPVLVAAHADVVPAVAQDWAVDPFAGTIKDGYLYGRGTLDNKGAVAAYARAVMRLAENKIPLARDVIFLSEADEEQGQYNTTWLANDHWSKMDAAFVLNEGGGPKRDATGKVTHVEVSYADKITLSLRMKAKGPSGHSSRPLPITETANGKLIEALYKLSHYKVPVHLLPGTRDTLKALADIYPQELGKPVTALLAAADDKQREAAAQNLVVAGSSVAGWGLEGLMRDTVVITMINSGIKPNVIPGEAEAVFNCRLLPGTKVNDFIAHLRDVIGDPDLELEIVNSRPKDQLAEFFRKKEAMAPSSLDTDLYRAIGNSARLSWPGAKILPTLMVASTDATPWREHGVPVYGIAPFPLDPDSQKGVHGIDERIAVTSIYEGTAFVYNILRDVAEKK